MNLAQHAWDAGGVARVLELLEQHRPKTGETELRGFEWHYLHRLCHANLLLTLKGHINQVNNVVFSPDGKRLASVAFGRTIKEGAVKVWDAQTGQELLTLKGHTNVVSSVAFSPDGKRLASAGGGRLKVWDAQTGQELLAFKVGRYVAFSPDGKRLANAGGQTVTIWDATPQPEKP